MSFGKNLETRKRKKRIVREKGRKGGKKKENGK
jgi:hypothetical protein